LKEKPFISLLVNVALRPTDTEVRAWLMIYLHKTRCIEAREIMKVD